MSMLSRLVFLSLTLTSSLAYADACTNIQTYGGAGDGSTDNSPALSAALAGSGPTGGCISFPAGLYIFKSQVYYTFPASRKHVSLVGSGPDSTLLQWQNNGDGIGLFYKSQYNSSTVRDLSINSNQAGTGYGLAITQSDFLGSFPTTLIDNVVFQGSDGAGHKNYWDIGIYVSGVSGVNIENVTVFGNSTSSNTGSLLTDLGETTA